MKNLGLTLGILGGIAIICFGVYMKVGIWNECRATNSFWYCWHLVNAR